MSKSSQKDSGQYAVYGQLFPTWDYLPEAWASALDKVGSFYNSNTDALMESLSAARQTNMALADRMAAFSTKSMADRWTGVARAPGADGVLEAARLQAEAIEGLLGEIRENWRTLSEGVEASLQPLRQRMLAPMDAWSQASTPPPAARAPADT